MKTSSLRNLSSDTLLNHLHEKLSHLPKVEQDTRIDECLKYLFLASLLIKEGSDVYVIPVNYDIHEVWHECIIQTHEYAALCRALPGKTFIHHTSAEIGYRDPLASTDPDAAVNELLWWLQNYCLFFEGFTEDAARHWTIVNFLEHALGLSLEEINRIGRGEHVQITLAA